MTEATTGHGADPARDQHPFLRGPEIADRVARLLQGISSRASEIEADIAREAQTAADEDTARRLGTLLARWSATVGAYEQASMGLQLWASAAVVPHDAVGPGAREVPEDTARLTRAAVERLESPALTPRVIGVREDAVAAAPLLDASSGAAGPRTVTAGSEDLVVSLRAAGPYPVHLEDDPERLADQFVSQSRGAVSVGVARRRPVPITVTVRADPPRDARDDDAPPSRADVRAGDAGVPTDPDDLRWDHVVEASVVAPEGLLVLEGAGTPVLRVQVPIGVWRVRAYSEGLATVDPDRLDGRDAYHLVLWRGRSLPDAVVVKRWRAETADAVER